MDDKNSEEIKIVDKRRFDSSGEKKDGVEEKAEEKKAEQPKASQAEAPPQEVDFPTFIVSMATQAMMLMGEVPEELRQEQVNLPAAKQTIDIIALLEEKTKGNLNDQEAKLVSDVLMSLRMAYVAKTKEAFTG